jgi:serine/threonine-protein kinase
LSEHVVFRLHESSRNDRLTAYHLALLCVRLLPHVFHNPDNQHLLESLQQNWEPLYFLHSPSTAVHLAFLLAKPLFLMEMVENGKDVDDALFALIELGCSKLAKETTDLSHYPEMVEALRPTPKEGVSKRSLIHIFQNALDQGRAQEILPYLTEEFHAYRIWAHLLLGQYAEAEKLFETFDTYNEETSPLYPLFGCYLFATQGEAAALTHFSGLLPTQFPRTSTLLGHYLKGNLDLKKGWISHAFPWEKIQLYRYLTLFAHCSQKPEEAKHFTKLLQRENRAIIDL